jgi:hypothetical protein
MKRLEGIRREAIIMEIGTQVLDAAEKLKSYCPDMQAHFVVDLESGIKFDVLVALDGWLYPCN